MAQTIGTLLLVLGILDALAALFCLCGGPLGAFGALAEGRDDAPFMLVFYLAYGVLLAGLSTLKILAATRVYKRTGWKLAMAAAIACFVNTALCCNVVSLVMGIVCLVLLLKPEVQAELGVAPMS
ncbi:MAG: hypothetical protein ACK4YP_03945 [Myxococcota bacterium]